MNTNNGHIACECQNTYIPVDFYGDVLCGGGPLPHVREIIKIYEPDQQLPLEQQQTQDMQRSSGDNCPLDQIQQSQIQYQHMIYEESQEPQYMLCTSQAPQQCGLLMSPSPQQINIENSPKRFIDHENDNKTFLRAPETNMPLVIMQTNEQTTEQITENIPESGANQIEPKVQPSEGKIYRSHTTIMNTPTGVKIITDISYDLLLKSDRGDTDISYSADMWAGRRVETDIPQSNILRNFEEKVKASLESVVVEEVDLCREIIDGLKVLLKPS